MPNIQTLGNLDYYTRIYTVRPVDPPEPLDNDQDPQNSGQPPS